MSKIKDLLVTLYWLRHQESVQNRQGFGDEDTELTEEGKRGSSELSDIVRALDINSIDYIIAGTLIRHTQTLDRIKEDTGYKGLVVSDERLNAFFSGPLLNRPAEETEQEYQLNRFKPGAEGRCDAQLPDGRKVSFDPKQTGVNPFDPLYCRAYVDKKLRQAVFPSETSLMPFEVIGKRVIGFQKDIIDKVKENEGAKPLKLVILSSCSPSSFNLEYAAFGTIGEHMLYRFGSENRVVFPQDHDEIMVLGYAREDLDIGQKHLRAIDGNVKIVNYLKRLRG